MEVKRCETGEDEILSTPADSINLRSEVEEMLVAFSPKRQPRPTISMPLPTVEPGENLMVISFDGAARAKRKSEAYSAIVWKRFESIL